MRCPAFNCGRTQLHHPLWERANSLSSHNCVSPNLPTLNSIPRGSLVPVYNKMGLRIEERDEAGNLTATYVGSPSTDVKGRHDGRLDVIVGCIQFHLCNHSIASTSKPSAPDNDNLLHPHSLLYEHHRLYPRVSNPSIGDSSHRRKSASGCH